MQNDPHKSNYLYNCVFALTIFSITAVIVVIALRPDKDNTPIISSILGFVVPIVGLLLAGQNKQQSDRLDSAAEERRQTSNDVKELKTTVDGHLTKLVAASFAEGVKDTTDANQRAASDVAMVAAHDVGVAEGVAIGRGAAIPGAVPLTVPIVVSGDNRPIVPVVPVVTAADSSDPLIVGQPVEVIIQPKGGETNG